MTYPSARKIGILLSCLCLPLFLSAQLQDDFSDGDFTSNPEWTGNTDRFIVNADNELQLNHTDASGTTNSYLVTAAQTAGETIWEFKVQLDFSPSTSNFAKVYLNSNSADLTAELNGYYVKIGGISGNDDTVELWRQDGDDDELLITGTPGGAGTEPVNVSVRVQRSAGADWVLLVDFNGGTDYLSQGGANDGTYDFGGFFGFWCRYTATRSDKFFFDDILIDPLFVDDVPPELLSAEAISPTQVQVNFNEEPVNFEIGDFTINNSITLTSATPNAQNPSAVNLIVSPALENFQTYTLTVENIEDAEGNVLTSASTDFDFFQALTPEPGDIILTEIFADPTPQVGLPDAEYVEIFNNSNKVIELSDLYFVSDDSPDQLGEGLILPGEYYIVCDDGFASDFTGFGNVVAATNFPALTNGGDIAALELANGTRIDGIEYTDDWYQDGEKALGGYSLERIDTSTASDCALNWRASLNPSGGTPGAENSVIGQFLSSEAPRLVSLVPVDEFSLELTFSAEPDAAEAGEELNYSVDKGLEVFSATLLSDNQTVLLVLSEGLEEGTIYTLTVSNAVGDCRGNMAAEDQVKNFGLAQEMLPGDVLINEVLFNPRTGGTDYVELFNTTEKIFNFTTETGAFQIFPGDYVVLSEKPDTVASRFFVENPSNLYLDTLPNLANDAGEYVLRIAGVTIDSFVYSESQHYELLRSEDGVSLERISPEVATNQFDNWHSAAASAGYGTPTARNSQFREVSLEAPIEFFDIPNPRVSPDEDGFEDVMLINYAFDEVGYTANIKIYDSEGREIKSLYNNELLGREGVLKWDGSTDAASKARVGIYILWTQVFRPDGTVVEQKEAVVVAGFPR